MTNDITYRLFQPGDEYQVHDLVKILFDAYVAPDCQPAGIKKFLETIEPGATRLRNTHDNFMFVAGTDKRIVGVVEVRDHSHVMLFFVESMYHKHGIGTHLFELAKKQCRELHPGLKKITVNSSLYAVSVYERLGFCKLDGPHITDGIAYVPMACYL